LDLVSTITVFENAIERIIGAEKGTVHIVDRKILKLFYKKINT
jgi:hypothetical protein